MKTLLILSSFFILVACNGLPDFPDVKPTGIKPSVMKAWPCKITDKENLKFECSKTSVPLTEAGLEGGYAFSAKDTKTMINFGREAKKYAEEHCE